MYKWKWSVIFLFIALVGIIVAYHCGLGIAGNEYKAHISTLQSKLSEKEIELEQAIKPMPLEDRFANLMESLSDDGVMKYDVDINAHLFSDNDMPDTINITLHLKQGQQIK